MIFYDFEVFEKDWLAVFIDVTKKKEHVIINSPDKLKALYEANRKDIWVGFNNRHYDQYIMKQKYHLYISANEHSEIIKNLIRLKNKLQSEGRYTDAVDDLIIKFSSAKMKSIQIK